MIVFAVGSTDRLFFRLHISYSGQIHFWRVGVWVLPIIVFFATLQHRPRAPAQRRRIRCARGTARSCAAAPTAASRCSRESPDRTAVVPTEPPVGTVPGHESRE